MKKFFTSALMGLAAAALMLGGAYASDKPLTEDQAKRFVETMEPVRLLGEKLKEQGENGALDIDPKPGSGEPFKPYSKAVAIMKEKFPAEHGELKTLVKKQGFTPAEWGAVGDRVIVAYLAIKMLEENPDAFEQIKQMEQIDPAFLQQMPPQMRAQIESTMAMAATMKDAPEADKKVVEKVKPELDAYMEHEQAERDKALEQ